MLYLLYLLLSLFPAHADTYTLELVGAFPIKQTTAPTAGRDGSLPVGLMQLIGSCAGDDCPYNGTETTVGATWWNGSTNTAWTYTVGGVTTNYVDCLSAYNNGRNQYYVR